MEHWFIIFTWKWFKTIDKVVHHYQVVVCPVFGTQVPKMTPNKVLWHVLIFFPVFFNLFSNFLNFIFYSTSIHWQWIWRLFKGGPHQFTLVALNFQIMPKTWSDIKFREFDNFFCWRVCVSPNLIVVILLYNFVWWFGV